MKRTDSAKKIAFAGIIAALSFAGYTFFPAINAFGLKIHLGNTFVVLGALILGGLWGGLAGAVGLSLADILGGWAEFAPITFVCKLIIGLITGLFAHKIAKINEPHDKAYTIRWSLISSIAGLACNTLADPFLNYLWQRMILQDAEVLLTLNFAVTGINAAVNTVCAFVLYLALRPALKRMQII